MNTRLAKGGVVFLTMAVVFAACSKFRQAGRDTTPSPTSELAKVEFVIEDLTTDRIELRNISVPLLMAKPSSPNYGMFEIGLDRGMMQLNLAGSWITNRLAFHVDDIRTLNDVQLKPRDLRIGNHLAFSYDQRHYDAPGKPVVLNVSDYVVPTKPLRLTLTLDIPKRDNLPAEGVRNLLITYLSWRLPRDVYIVDSDNSSEKAYGELKVSFRLIKSGTMWTIRSEQWDEQLSIQTKLADANASTNWEKLSFTGGQRPGESDLPSDEHAESSLAKVPIFSEMPQPENRIASPSAKRHK
jgi:hypothetical protein